MGNRGAESFQKTNYLEVLYKYTTRANLLLSWAAQTKSVCCSAETSIYCTVHQSPSLPGRPRPPTHSVLKHSQETVIKPFPQVTQIRPVKAANWRKETCCSHCSLARPIAFMLSHDHSFISVIVMETRGAIITPWILLPHKYEEYLHIIILGTCFQKLNTLKNFPHLAQRTRGPALCSLCKMSISVTPGGIITIRSKHQALEGVTLQLCSISHLQLMNYCCSLRPKGQLHGANDFLSMIFCIMHVDIPGNLFPKSIHFLPLVQGQIAVAAA